MPEGLDLEWFTDELLAAARKGEVNPFEPGALPPPEILEPYRSQVPARQARLMPELQDMDGSNNWVVSGRHTASGVPILSNDPHRTIEMPALRYFVHLSAPGWNVIGGGEPPFVGVDAGHNETMAWGFTFAGTDMVDVFVEETNPANPNETKYNGAWEPMTVIREEIPVKGEVAAQCRAEVLEARAGVLRGHDTPPGVRGEVGDPGAWHRALQGQPQAGAGGELRRLLRPRDVVEGADAQPDLRRHQGQHRAAGDRA